MHDQVAIVGMAVQFPDCPDKESFWNLVVQGKSTIKSAPMGRWGVSPQDIVSPKPQLDHVLSANACFIDPMSISLSQEWRDLLADLDPVYSLTIDTGLKAISDCNSGAIDKHRAGVMIGNLALPTEQSSKYVQSFIEFASRDQSHSLESLQPANLSPLSLPAAMLASALGFKGGAHTLDAACASSLYAVKLAVDALLTHRLDCVVTGGVSRPDSLYTQMGFSQLSALSPSGICRPFDERGDGLIVGEGCGLFVLKRLSDAIKHNDQIYGVIAGVGLSNDHSGSLMAPDSEGQTRAMGDAYSAAGLNVSDMDLIECHATGTPLGDKTEVQSLMQLWQKPQVDRKTVLGSVKSNVGHLLTAAGAASLARCLLSLRHKTLPPTAHFEKPIKQLIDSPFEVLKEARAWPKTQGQPRRAAVSGFGFGGINGHIIIEEWNGETPRLLPKSFTKRRVALVAYAYDTGKSPVAISSQWGDLGKTALANSLQGRIHTFGDVKAPLRAFRTPPHELMAMLPQQLVMLMNAAFFKPFTEPLQQKDRWGTLIGIGLDEGTNYFYSRWTHRLEGQERDQALPALTADKTMGSLGGLVASRVARFLGFGGPSFTLSSDGASGLTAFITACNMIQAGELEGAFVGAVDLCSQGITALTHLMHHHYQAVSDGVAGFLLKDEAACLRDGDPIICIIKDWHTSPTSNPSTPKSLARDYYGCSDGLISLAKSLEQTISDQSHFSYVPTEHAAYPSFTLDCHHLRHVRGIGSITSYHDGLDVKLHHLPDTHRPLELITKPHREPPPMLRPYEELSQHILKTMTDLYDAESAYLQLNQQMLANWQHLQSSLGMLPNETLSLMPEEPISPKSTSCFMDYNECLTFARGKVGDVLGPSFAVIDSYPTRVRLPDEPLMLCHRIESIDAIPLSMTHGSMVTAHDIKNGAWYLDSFRIPTCIAVEAGQADLFLSGYLGIDLKTKGQAVYRLLDAKVTFHSDMPGPGTTILYHISIHEFFSQGETTLFRFGFEATVDGKPFLSMTHGCAGFFSENELRHGKGLVFSTLDLATQTKGHMTGGYAVHIPLTKTSLTQGEIRALELGDYVACFGQAYRPWQNLTRKAVLPGGYLRLVDRIVEMNSEGGRYGIGFVKGEADIHPDDWFLTCHFVDDQVMPGTLMFECCLHTLRIYLMATGWLGFDDPTPGTLTTEPVIGSTGQLKCRGQVTATTKVVTYEVSIREIGYNPDAYCIADAVMYADGKAIVEIKNMSLHHKGLTKERVHAISPDRSTIVNPASKALYEKSHIVAYATGEPSQGFGAPYRIFDSDNQGGRILARLPRDPMLYVDRITHIEAKPFVMEAQSKITAAYDVPPDAWYFGDNGGKEMPFATLLEVALQPCGWFAAYMGSALTSSENLCFRNLDGKAILHKRVTRDSGTLYTDVVVKKIAKSFDMIVQEFSFRVYDDHDLVYEGETVFGFFTKKALAQQIGLRQPEWHELYQKGLELEASNAFHKGPYPRQSPFAPRGRLSMIDEITYFDPKGGSFGKGFIIGKRKVTPDDWYFDAHFYQDPVQPGSLGLEAFLQLLRYAGFNAFGDSQSTEPAIASIHEWTYRGQVIPRNKEITIMAEVSRVDTQRRELTASGVLAVDGLAIYGMKDFTISLAAL